MRVNTYRVQLVKELGINYNAIVTTPAGASALLERLYSASARCEEHTWQICLDTKGNVVGVFELATGTVCSCAMDTFAIARNALLANAYAVIISHNHPSGDPTPSGEDIAMTKQVRDGLALLNITMYDHVIIGNTTLSMREHGYI